jgi:hypothetical protein
LIALALSQPHARLIAIGKLDAGVLGLSIDTLAAAM